MLDVLWWRYWACPRTTEAAARDFLMLRNPQRVRSALADPDSWYDSNVTDYKRRIASTYGLASSYNIHTTGKWSPGWNRWLLADAGFEPEKAAEHILGRVCVLAKIHENGRQTLPPTEQLLQ